MTKRDLPTLLGVMLNLIPSENTQLRRQLESVRQSALYAAPEAQREWFLRTAEVLNEIPYHPNQENPFWVNAVVSVWMDRKMDEV